MTGIIPDRLETILPARRRPNYRPLLRTHIDDTRDAATQTATELPNQEVIIYSDGSGYGGEAGAAASLWINGTKKKTLRYHLGSLHEHTVYEAELIGVILGIYILLKYRGDKIFATIALDNQAVIRALTDQTPKPSHYLLDKIHDLVEDLQHTEMKRRTRKGMEGYRCGQGGHTNEAGGKVWKNWKLKKEIDLEILWVPGHEGIQGNEDVDVDAKRAAEGQSSELCDLPPFLRHKPLKASASATKQRCHEDVKRTWTHEWERSPRYKRINAIDPSLPSKQFIKSLTSLSRRQSNLIVQLWLGHIPLNQHLHRFKCAPTPNCPHCGNGAPETILHFLVQCPKYNQERHMLNRKLKHRAHDIDFLFGHETAILPLLLYVHTTSRLRETFGAIKPRPLT